MALDALYNIILDGPRDFESLVAEMEQQGVQGEFFSGVVGWCGVVWCGVVWCGYEVWCVEGGGGGGGWVC